MDAWREWNRREVIEELDSASDGLVGLLWRNLDAHGVEHHTMPKLKGVYRHTWFKNQSVLRQAGFPIRALREAGTPTLALKGATLCPVYYRDWACGEWRTSTCSYRRTARRTLWRRFAR